MARVRAGTVLAGRYRLLKLLGEGSMGAVWRAEHLSLRAPVAVKVLDESIAKHSVALARFMREAQAAAALSSLHIVQIHDFGVEDDAPFIAMELLAGETLGERIAREGKLSPQETATWLTHVARGIGKAHQAGVIHRDLKPDNIFLVLEDEQEYAKVLDFGVAKAGEGVFAATLTSAGKLLGTPGYMSAEQAGGDPVDFRTDIWSMAVIAFECLTGNLPFVGDNLPDLLFAIHDGPIPVPSRVARVPMGFDEWFQRGVARNRDQRFQSIKQAAAELRILCGVGNGRDASWSGFGLKDRGESDPSELGPVPAVHFAGLPGAQRRLNDPEATTRPAEKSPLARSSRRMPVAPRLSANSDAPPPGAAWSEPPSSFDEIIRDEDILPGARARRWSERPASAAAFAPASSSATLSSPELERCRSQLVSESELAYDDDPTLIYAALAGVPGAAESDLGSGSSPRAASAPRHAAVIEVSPPKRVAAASLALRRSRTAVLLSAGLVATAIVAGALWARGSSQRPATGVVTANVRPARTTALDASVGAASSALPTLKRAETAGTSHR
jgi:serine/threonine-protein kinase